MDVDVVHDATNTAVAGVADNSWLGFIAHMSNNNVAVKEIPICSRMLTSKVVNVCFVVVEKEVIFVYRFPRRKRSAREFFCSMP